MMLSGTFNSCLLKTTELKGLKKEHLSQSTVANLAKGKRNTAARESQKHSVLKKKSNVKSKNNLSYIASSPKWAWN